MNSWFRGLTNTGKVLVISAFALLSFGTAGTLAQPNRSQVVNDTPDTVQPTKSTPVTIKSSEIKTEIIAFQEETKEDATLTKGQTKVFQEGISGERAITYESTKLEGKEVERKEIKNEVTKTPVNRVILVGTYVAPPPVVVQKPVSSCDPNYSGCVPIASDVDCAGGSGNGPAYVSGPVRVIGNDIYGLDRDNDGLGCE
jgi:resuscitation-promoting factor RpfB